MTTRAEPLSASEALRRSGFTEYRKKLLTSISDTTFPPGTTYQTPEGLKAEDEETRCAFDVQGGIYPIRESVFQASYELPDAARDQREGPPGLDVELLARALHIDAESIESDPTEWDDCEDKAGHREYAAFLAAEYARAATRTPKEAEQNG